MVLVEILGTLIVIALLVAAIGLLAFELNYRFRPRIQLEVTSGNWKLTDSNPQKYRIVGEISIHNYSPRFEIMVPELTCDLQLFSKSSLEGIHHRTRIIPHHPDAEIEPRDDGYWFAYIVKTQKSTRVEVVIEIDGTDLRDLKLAWIRLPYVSYSPNGRLNHIHHVVMPLQFPSPEDSKNWRNTDSAQVLPIKTHLLTPLDNPVDVVKRYVSPHAKPGDIVTIGETPVAIMQSRWRYPTDVHPGWLARRICLFFLPTSSLATACGMQTLIDVEGGGKVLFAFIVGSLAKIFGRKGVFYQLAGEQARLIDDVTGTLPPYDQFIVLGPDQPQAVVDQIQKETGLAAAIVDVNDLKAVKILAATSNVAPGILEQALRSNPAGNSDEQTPVVLVRPTR